MVLLLTAAARTCPLAAVVQASKFEQTVRTRFKGALVDWQGQEPSSIDG